MTQSHTIVQASQQPPVLRDGHQFTILNSKLFKTVLSPSSVPLPPLPAFLPERVRRPILHRSPDRSNPRSDDPGWNRGCRPSIALILASNFLTGNDTPEQRPD